MRAFIYRLFHPREFITISSDDIDWLVNFSAFMVQRLEYKIDKPIWVGGFDTKFKVRLRMKT